MSKGSKNIRANKKTIKDTPSEKKQIIKPGEKDNEYLFNMSHAPALGESSHWFQMLPVLFFTAVIIMIVRMAPYSRPLQQFFFMGQNEQNLTDFFSYYKISAIIACAVLAITILLYKIFAQSFYIKRSYAYVPMVVYLVFVLLSYLFSEYKIFALWGWIDRFEGTVVLFCYIIMLFYIINLVNSEKNVKWIINLLAITGTILGLLGITQAMNHDFFRTVLGKKMITPSSFWSHIDSLSFTFTDQIYQTVYNINYVSFYLTLLIPIFGLLFIRSFIQGKDEPIYKKIIWAALFALLVFNLIGSASSGGLMGMAFVVLIGIIVLNKRIMTWWKPIVILALLTVIIASASYNRWMPELTGAINGVSGQEAKQNASVDTHHKFDYLVTTGNAIKLGYEGDEITFTTYPEDPSAITITDANGNPLSAVSIKGDHPEFRIQDDRYDWISVKPAKDSNQNYYTVIVTDDKEWPFSITPEGPLFRNGTGRFMPLEKVPAIGWENNQEFGSGRGYIWSRTIPMLKDTMLLGYGADTYCIYFPHQDYVGKYNSGTFSQSIDIVVDKPHNMYFGTIIGTGGVSMLALLALWGFYLVQSFNLYRKQRYTSYISYVGAGIFFGICGFLIAGLVNDSTVSVMPMFYGLLGTGIAINIMLKKQPAE